MDTQQSFFVAGVGQEHQLNIAELCGGADQITRIETAFTPRNWALTLLTFNLYAPRQARVYCRS